MRKQLIAAILLVAVFAVPSLGASFKKMGDPQFLELVQNGSEQEIIKAIQNGANVNAKGKFSKTALMYAAERCSSEVIHAMIKAGALNYKEDITFRTALMYAAQSNSPEVVNVLVRAGASINEQDKHGKLPLIYAVEKNSNHKTIQALIYAGANVNIRIGRYFDLKTGLLTENVTPLMIAAQVNTPETVETLIGSGADVNAKNKEGMTPLMYAAQNNPNPDVIEILIDAGAEDLADNYGITALMYAARDNTPEVVETLLDAGAYLGAKSNQGRTALDYAMGRAIGGSPNQKLYGSNALLRLAGQSTTSTPRKISDGQFLKIVSTASEQEIIEAVKRSANVNAKDEYGATPLMTVSQRAMPGAVSALINAGADVNAHNMEGWSALICAVNCFDENLNTTENIDTVSLIIKAGADVNNTDITAATALIYAAEGSGPEIVSMLLDAGADAKIENKYGQKAVDYARENEELKGSDVLKRLEKLSK